MFWSCGVWHVSKTPVRVTGVDCVGLAPVVTGSLIWIADLYCAWALSEVSGSVIGFDLAVTVFLQR